MRSPSWPSSGGTSSRLSSPCPGGAKAAEETTPGNAPVLLDLPTLEGFLGYLKGQGRTERRRKNVLHDLAQWTGVLYGKGLRQLRLRDLEQALNGWYDAEVGDIPARRHRSAAIQAFCSWLREEEAVLTTARQETSSGASWTSRGGRPLHQPIPS